MVNAQCVYYPAELLLGDTFPDITKKADECARRMSAYPENHILANLRAMHYRCTGNVDEEKRAWLDILNHGRGFVVEEAIAAMFFWDQLADLPSLANQGVEAETAMAFIAAYGGDNERAYATYERLAAQYRTWYARHKLLQILLLVCKEDEAREVCRSWAKNSVGAEHFGDWEKRSIEFVAGIRSLTDFTAAAGDPIGEFFSHYQLAYLAYARGQRSEAQQHFEKCTQWTYPDERQHWARAFAQRLRLDATTPDAASK
jgi:hypothetical protein